MLEFDAATAALLDRAYRGRDFLRRRHANIEALDPRADQHLLDIGCGTGLMVADLSRAVGAGGHVTGLDPSADMLEKAEAACTGLANVTLARDSVEAMPFDDARFDGAVSVQVFEYFADLAPALAECRRVLRPGARLVIGDMHFDTLAWHSEDPDRMAQVIAAWDGHFVDRAVPGRLPGLLGAAGFSHRASVPVTFLDTRRRPDGLARMMQVLMAGFAASSGAVAEEEAQAWSDEQDALASRGAFFFSLTHVVTVAEAV